MFAGPSVGNSPSTPSGPGTIAVVSEVRIHGEGVADRLRCIPEIKSVSLVRAEDCSKSQLERHAFSILVVDASTVPSMLLDRLLDGAGANVFDALTLKLLAYGLAKEDEESILGYASLGARGLVFNNAHYVELQDAVLAVLRGEIRCPRSAAATLLRNFGWSSSRCSRLNVLGLLTRRQREALVLRLAGESNKRVAVRMGIELGTVKREVHDALRRLSVRSVRDAASLVGMSAVELREQTSDRALNT